MNQGPEDPPDELGSETAASNEAGAISTCPRCGTKMPASRPADRCPVCQLRKALDPEVESELPLPTGGRAVASPGTQPIALLPNRFDHYQLLAHDDGTPIELTFVVVGNIQVCEGRHSAPGIEQNTEDRFIPNVF